MEDFLRLLRERLFEAFYDWLEKNKHVISENNYTFMFNEAKKKGEDVASTPIGILGTAMWMLNMMGSCGVMAGVGVNGVSDQTDYKETGFDEKSTRRLLLLICASMCLQYLPPEMINQPIPVISPKKFSLKLYVEKWKKQSR